MSTRELPPLEMRQLPGFLLGLRRRAPQTTGGTESGFDYRALISKAANALHGGLPDLEIAYCRSLETKFRVAIHRRVSHSDTPVPPIRSVLFCAKLLATSLDGDSRGDTF